MTTTLAPSVAEYRACFEAEQARHYPMVDAFERTQGFAVGRERLEGAACILACPLKAHPPNWQHGRVLYAFTRAYLAHRGVEPVGLVDIGTAKGFSALCLRWALDDEHLRDGVVFSTDVIHPLARVRRNTVAEVGGYRTLDELLDPWPEARRIVFRHGSGTSLLASLDRVHVAFLDGKHTEDEVTREVDILAPRQQPGDRVVFDDVQIPGVRRAVDHAARWYTLTVLALTPERQYALGVRQ